MPTFTGKLAGGGSPSSGPSFTGKAKQKPKKKGKSPFGFVQNVAGDIADITTGIVPATIATGKALGGDVAQAVEDAVRLGTGADPPQRLTEKKDPFGRTKEMAGQIKKGYVDMYGPLFKGDFDKFLDNLYEDPVYVGLDVLTITSGATKLFVKVVPKAAKAGKTIQLVTPSGKPVGKALSRSELRAQLQAAAAKAANKGTVFGKRVRPEGVTAAKVERTKLARRDVNLRAGNQEFDVALKKMRNQPARVATALRARYDRQALNEYVALLKQTAAKEGPNSPAAQTLKVITNPRVQRLFDNPSAKMEKVIVTARDVAEQQKGLLKVADETAESRRFLPARIAGGARFDPDLGEWVGGPSVDDLKARGLDPIYMPDTSAKARTVEVGRGSGGIGVTQPTGNMKQNRGVLQMAGQVVLDPATLNESFLRAAKYEHYSGIHNKLLDFAEPIDYPRPGMTLIRKKRSDRVPARDRHRSDFEEWADTHLDDEGNWKTPEDGLTTTDRADAVMTPEGKYLAVPDSVAKALAGEFTQQGKFWYYVNKYPMRVWRALVLGLRPAYLVNNAVGNTLMYLFHSARPEDLRQLAGAFKQFAKKSQGKQIDAMLKKHFAGQIRGGFVATQMPEFAPASRIGRAAAAVVNAIPALDRRWEQALRRAKVKAELKRHPALKVHAERMGSENAFFEKVAPMLDENPDIVTQVYDRVNDALGDYDHMTKFEKNIIRNFFPFAAWFKAIVGVSAKLAIEQPLKVNLFARLGEVAVEQNLSQAGLNRDEIPTSLLGFIPLRKEGNRVRGFNTTPANPYATVAQIAEAVAALTQEPGQVGKKLPGFNPLVGDILAQMFGQTMAGYGVRDIPGAGTFDSLPQSRLLGALETKYGIDFPLVKPAPDGDTFNDRDVIDELLRYLGVPYARVSPSAAKRVATR